MDQKAEDALLHQSTVGLTRAASEMSAKIKNQSFIIEAISSEARANLNKFADNTDVFDRAIDGLDNDRRNRLIIFLVVLIIILLYYLKYQ